ncbi:carbohydrate-binding domain-containing protein [Intestinimonas sp. HCP28S3_D6]|uniref:carbohydrate-binding domain-containing protein n=1 Tax=Intestinimonas sp. HCP28S3_D6 TaxID=3438942 RepID=UPI003F8BCCE8
MKQTKRKLTAILLCGLLLLSGCGAQNTAEDASSTDTGTASSGNITAATVSAIDTSGVFSDRDLEGTYDASAAIPILLNGDSASCDSSSVAIDGSTITIAAEGVYLISGTLNDGQIIVNAGDTDKVQLVLAGADITSSTSAAIYALEADKVFITLAEGTENTLTNGGEYIAIDDNNIDAVIFAKTDLTLNGSGSLTINAQAGHGVVSKDELVITGGSYTITAASHGLSGKDSVAIADGTFAITSGKDGIHAENSDDTSLGWLYIQDGSFTIRSQGDAISAQGALQIDDGTFDLYTGEGSASVEMTSSDQFGGPMGGGQRGGWTDQTTAPDTQATSTTQTEEDSTSQKGIKGESIYAINGGTFTIDSADDCLHAGGAMTIAAGDFTLNSGDDAVHCDDALTIQSGTFTIPYCYEGIEGLSITIEDGVFDITSNDDGLNAAGGADSSGFGGFGNRSQDTFAASSDSFIIINGGAFTIVSGGDSVDSNGDLTINGGTLDLTCNGAGDTAIDCDGTYTNNGGDVTTNDGSESNPGQMGGGKAGMEGRTGTDGQGDMRSQGGSDVQGGMRGQDGAVPSGDMRQTPGA